MTAATATRGVTPDRLVIEVNRAFHDLEGRAYDHKHDEIFLDEAERWRDLGARLLGPDRPARSILDVGTGTGFVPLQLGPFLQSEDHFTCSDLSACKLDCCEQTIARAQLVARFDFALVDGEQYPFADGQFDLITMNSVAHHVPDLDAFFRELDRMLAPGGRIVVAHEPNAAFYRSRALWALSRGIRGVLHPVEAASVLARVTGLRRVLGALGVRAALRGLLLRLRGRQQEVAEQATLVADVNRRLLDEGVIDAPLSGEEITTLVDFHSPTAGERLDRTRGLDLPAVVASALPGHTIEEWITYHHLGEATRSHPLAAVIDRWLARRYPHHGASLCAVLRKPESATHA